MIEDAVPEEYRALADAKAASRPAGGSPGGDDPLGDGAPATAVLRAITPPRGTTVLRAIPDPALAAEPEPAEEPGNEEAPPSTGWTGNVQLGEVAALAARSTAAATAATAATVGGGLRGRILAVEGGYGSRRGWGRGGSGQAPVLSTMLAAVAPQTLLAAEAVDAVHLPSASDPQTVFAHLRAAARHPGPLLVHLGGHLVLDKRGGGLYLTLRDSKTGTVRQDSLAWSAVTGELRARPADWDTLVIADLSAEQAAWPYLQAPQFTEGLPLWAVVAPDPEQIGTFTRALVECLHGGRPGAGPILAPEQVRAQVHSVIRPDALTFSAYPADRAVFKNNARQQPAPAVPLVPAAPAPVEQPVEHPVAERAERGPVSLLKPGVPPTVRPSRPVTLLKGEPPMEQEQPQEAPSAQEPAQDVDPQSPPADYREALGRIVATAEAGDHAGAAELAGTLEQQAVAAHGMIAPPVLMIRQVRAHLARMAGDLTAAVGLYREVALVLLVAQGPQDQEAQRVVTNAEACWRAIPDPAVALPLSPAVLELRAKVPGEDDRKLRSTERYAAKLAKAADPAG
ncbi:hypothetical protein FHX73_11220 [Kitasatospora viridis]|uniref:Uncharacterized protein n=1 Tax=Kitasatospora viridis TaxID=281105 RepID=A0A561UAQ6_9ACTN|nr:hypothetical protein FHX73_11220 [Kitasatospora viridis]